MRSAPHRQRQIERLTTAHTAVSRAVRSAVEQGADLAATDEARTGMHRCVKMTAGEAQALLRTSLPRNARTAPAREAHALLFVGLQQLADELAAEQSGIVRPATIAAAAFLLDQLSTWLRVNNQVVCQPGDRLRDSLAERHRIADGLGRDATKLRPWGAKSPWHNDGYGTVGNAVPGSFRDPVQIDLEEAIERAKQTA